VTSRVLHVPVWMLVLMVGAWTAGCQSAPPAAPVQAPQTTADLNPHAFRQLWAEKLPVDNDDAVGRVYVDHDLVLACTNRNVVYVVNKSTGVLQFFNYVHSGTAIGRPVVLANELVYPALSSLEIYKRHGGEFEKSIPLDYSLSSDAIGVENDLYFGIDESSGEMVDYDASLDYHNMRWALMTFGLVQGAPAFYDGVIFVGSGDGTVRAVNTDRTGLWSLDNDAYQTDGAILGDIKADDSGVYAASMSGRLVCLDHINGKLKWQYIAPRGLQTGPIVTNDTIYQLVPDNGLAAIDKNKKIDLDAEGRHKIDEANRTPRWICPEAKQFLAQDDLFTYASSGNHALLILDKDTGRVRYRGLSNLVAFSTNPDDNTIYAVSSDGFLYALKPILRQGSPGYLE
jgi:outer membrane protein assembly factor BamB